MDALLRRRAMVASSGGEPPTPPPYDSRIEYLESTGTQYIDLDVLPSNDTGVEIDALWPFLDSTEIIGARTSNRYYEFLYNYFSGSTASLYYQYGTQTPRTTQFVDTNRNVFKSVKNSFYINGTNVFNANANTFYIQFPLCLFCLNKVGTKERFAIAKVYSVKVSQDQTMVRDMIPVRVGSVGYLYDRKSGLLFGNSGTGDFILGPDI